MKRSILTIALLSLAAAQLFASHATTFTFTPNPRGDYRFVRTGDAYLPEFTYTDLGLEEPQDLFVSSDDTMYIADTGNSRIVVFDTVRGRITRAISHEEFESPSGVWMDELGILYVADPKAGAVFCLDDSGAIVRTYTRPTEIAFGDRPFAPRKVAADSAGNLFIIGEGVYDGVIQLSPNGTFLGYFTSNKIQLSFTERLQDLLFTDAQKANLLARTPITFSNLFVDHRNILYTTTIGDTDSAVKKHNAAGLAIVNGPEAAFVEAAVDLWVSPAGIMVAVFVTGQTVIYTREGDIIAMFGYAAPIGDRAGIFERPSSVAMDSQGALWFLDEEKAFLQSYRPTQYIQDIFSALEFFNQGNYSESIRIWEEVLKVNQVSEVAHLSIGKNYLFVRDYERAMYHTRIANSREFYSQSFWEVRNVWLQRNVIYIVAIMAFLAFAVPLYRFLRKRVALIPRMEAPFRTIAAQPRIRAFLYQFRVIRHPADSFYDIRAGNEGSIGGAITSLMLFFVVFLAYQAGQGFIFQNVFVEDIDFTSLILGYFGIVLLFILSNYLGTSIHDGRGDLKDLLKMVGYSVAPLWLAMTVAIALSYVLTLNEVFAVEILMGVAWAYWAILLVVGLRETHGYDTRKALGSIFFSVVFMLIFVVIGVILAVLGQQVFQFFEALIKEFIRNVT